MALLTSGAVSGPAGCPNKVTGNLVMRDLKQLEADIRRIEGIVVGLDGDQSRFYRPYPLTRPSPGRMRGREWVEQFERIYPELDVTFPSLHLTLQDLRTRYEP